MTEKQTPWEFACKWYVPTNTNNAIVSSLRGHTDQFTAPPRNVESMDFAVWLTDQMRLAMRKGIELGRDWDSNE